jgi:hypothetical protein
MKAHFRPECKRIAAKRRGRAQFRFRGACFSLRDAL